MKIQGLFEFGNSTVDKNEFIPPYHLGLQVMAFREGVVLARVNVGQRIWMSQPNDGGGSSPEKSLPVRACEFEPRGIRNGAMAERSIALAWKASRRFIPSRRFESS